MKSFKKIAIFVMSISFMSIAMDENNWENIQNLQQKYKQKKKDLESTKEKISNFNVEITVLEGKIKHQQKKIILKNKILSSLKDKITDEEKEKIKYQTKLDEKLVPLVLEFDRFGNGLPACILKKFDDLIRENLLNNEYRMNNAARELGKTFDVKGNRLDFFQTSFRDSLFCYKLISEFSLEIEKINSKIEQENQSCNDAKTKLNSFSKMMEKLKKNLEKSIESKKPIKESMKRRKECLEKAKKELERKKERQMQKEAAKKQHAKEQRRMQENFSFDGMNEEYLESLSDYCDVSSSEMPTMAIIDTGFTRDNKNLKQHLNYDKKIYAFKSKKKDKSTIITESMIMDESIIVSEQSQSSHGSHVSGIAIKAFGDYSNHHSKKYRPIVPVKISANTEHSDEFIISLNELAKNESVVCINISWSLEAINSSSHKNKPLIEALKKCMNKGKLIVFSAGNDGETLSDTSYGRNLYKLAKEHPYQLIIVGACTNKGELADFSNKSSEGYTDYFITAPGVDIESFVPKSCNVFGLAKKDGTSMAAPYFTGVATRIKLECPYLSMENIAQILLSSAKKKEPSFGSGIIDIKASIAFIKNNVEKKQKIQSQLSPYVKSSILFRQLKDNWEKLESQEKEDKLNILNRLMELKDVLLKYNEKKYKRYFLKFESLFNQLKKK